MPKRIANNAWSRKYVAVVLRNVIRVWIEKFLLPLELFVLLRPFVSFILFCRFLKKVLNMDSIQGRCRQFL